MSVLEKVHCLWNVGKHSFLNSHLIYAANLRSFLQLKVEKKSMAPRHIGLVQNARMNLPRFIEYMNAELENKPVSLSLKINFKT